MTRTCTEAQKRTQFKPGESGNPKGPPRKLFKLSALDRMPELSEGAAAILKKQIANGDVRASIALLNFCLKRRCAPATKAQRSTQFQPGESGCQNGRAGRYGPHSIPSRKPDAAKTAKQRHASLFARLEAIERARGGK